jgi:hypothetical protein
MKTSPHLIQAACTALLAFLVLYLLVWTLGLPGPTSAVGEIPPDLTPVAYLPLAAAARTPTPTPVPPPGPVGLKVYDMDGAEKTYQWAVQKYGVQVDQIGGWAYHCVELREISGPSGVEVWVYQANGLPAANMRVEFWWPTGMDWRLTEPSGKAGFGYGPGSWIYDPAAGGPHWLVVANESSCDAVSRLGMLAGTPHDHLDVSYRYSYLSVQP